MPSEQLLIGCPPHSRFLTGPWICRRGGFRSVVAAVMVPPAPTFFATCLPLVPPMLLHAPVVSDYRTCVRYYSPIC